MSTGGRKELLQRIATAAREAVAAAVNGPDNMPESAAVANLPARLTVQETAAFLNCGKPDVQALIDTGELSAVDIAAPGAGRKCLRVTRESLAAYHQTKGASQPARAITIEAMCSFRGATMNDGKEDIVKANLRMPTNKDPKGQFGHFDLSLSLYDPELFGILKEHQRYLVQITPAPENPA